VEHEADDVPPEADRPSPKAEKSFSVRVLPHLGQGCFAFLPGRSSTSATWPQALHLYSKIGMAISLRQVIDWRRSRVCSATLRSLAK